MSQIALSDYRREDFEEYINKPLSENIYIWDEEWIEDESYEYYYSAFDQRITDLIYSIGKAKSSIYPNPTSDFLTIETGEKAGKLNIFVVNALGEILSQNNIEDGGTLFVEELPKGIYTISIISSSGINRTEKFIKQ